MGIHRKVEVREAVWVAATWVEDRTKASGKRLINGHWDQSPPYEAIFHDFAIDYEEVGGGDCVTAGNYPCAVIELPDGTVKSVRLTEIRFLEPCK